MPDNSSRTGFLLTKILVKFQRGHPQLGRQIQVGLVTVGNFRPISCYVSETVQDRDIVTMGCNRNSCVLYWMAPFSM